MCPLCAVAQPNVNFACLSFACVINYTLPGGVLGYQADVNTAILIYVRLICTFGALQGNYVTDKVSGIAINCLQIFVIDRAFILVVININNVDINARL